MSHTERRLNAAQKAKKTIELRCRGVGWDAVADMCGYSSAQNACRAVSNALAWLSVPGRRPASQDRGYEARQA
jgi:hypothetical protein